MTSCLPSMVVLTFQSGSAVKGQKRVSSVYIFPLKVDPLLRMEANRDVRVFPPCTQRGQNFMEF